jgi:ABC-2 type transport system ATP-binding protein
MAEVVASLRSVERAYGDVIALRDLSLDVPVGVVGVLGPNGAGKSTLFRLLLGLEVADAGTVQVFGHALPEQALEVRARIGYMPEDDCLFPGLTGLEQVLLAARLCGIDHTDAQPRAHRALDLCGIADLRYRPATTYSLGNRQRLRLAMALVHGPRLLLLDEPTAGLDPEGRAQMLELVRAIGAAGSQILLSTHVLADVEAVCDHVVLMSRGTASFAGTMAQFQAGAGGSAWLVDVDGDAAALSAALTEAGMGCTLNHQRLVLRCGEAQLPELWRAAARLELGVRAFRPYKEDMDAAFVRHLRVDDPLRQQAAQALEGRR